jgi:parvulin-like peptidyl-prolyl isomerase
MNFMKIDGADVDLATALKWRAAVGDDAFIQSTATDAAVVQYCAEKNISATSDEIQNVLSELRYMMELESAEQTLSWISENGLDQDSLAQACEIMALRNKIRDSITEDEIKEEFLDDQASYDIAEIYNITVDDEDLANEIASQLEDEEDSFYNLAVEHSIDEDTYLKGGYGGEVTRGDVRAEAEAAIFGAANGDVVGPIKEDDDHTIYMVRKIVKPEFDDVKDTIRDKMFEELIEGLSGTAVVEVVPLGTKTEPPEELDDEE